MSASHAQYLKDFREPRSARQTVFTPQQQGPIGTLVHCLLNRPIFCDEKSVLLFLDKKLVGPDKSRIAGTTTRTPRGCARSPSCRSSRRAGATRRGRSRRARTRPCARPTPSSCSRFPTSRSTTGTARCAPCRSTRSSARASRTRAPAARRLCPRFPSG